MIADDGHKVISFLVFGVKHPANRDVNTVANLSKSSNLPAASPVSHHPICLTKRISMSTMNIPSTPTPTVKRHPGEVSRHITPSMPETAGPQGSAF